MAKRFLCICYGGNVRSVGLAGTLKNTYGQEALAASALWNSEESFRMLVGWADYVVLMTTEVLTMLPQFVLESEKIVMCDVGPDVYGNPFHPDLQASLAPVVAEWNARDWNLKDPYHDKQGLRAPRPVSRTAE
jgi:hypothetical protein